MTTRHNRSRPRRITYDLTPFGLPEVPLLGYHHGIHARQNLPVHVHEGLMEICYLVEGQQVFSVHGSDYLMRGGDVFLTYPDERHSTGKYPVEKSLLYWLQLRLPATNNNRPGKNARKRKSRKQPTCFLGMTPAFTKPLTTALSQMPQRLFRGDRALKTLFERGFTLCQSPNDFTSVTLAAHLVELLTLVIHCANRPQKEMNGKGRLDRASSEPINRALRAIDDHLHDPLPLTTLAAIAGLSQSWFKNRFRHEIGISPAEYILRRKIDAAKIALRSRAHSVTDVAYRFGFSSSQYFATVFKRFTEMTPRDYILTTRKRS